MSASEARGEDMPEASVTLAGHRARLETLALAGFLLLFFSVLAYVNCVWTCYPIDNDLDEVGWLTAHLSLSRAESFANQGYPPGLPVLLRVLTPVVGSLLRAALLWQSIAATASIFFVYRISTALSKQRMAGPCALLCGVLAGLPVFTSEFADGTSTALFLAGLWLLTRRSGDRRGFFLFGLSVGLSYLFRTHYLILLAVVPTALVLGGFGWRDSARAALAFASGFAATAWPLWMLNLLAYGTPLHAGVSQYNIAYAVDKANVNWENYAQSYNHWPLARLLRERPLDLLANSRRQIVTTLAFPLSLAGAGLGAFAVVLATERVRRQLIAFCGLLALTYVAVVIVPTRYTDRAYAPVAMICSVLVACGLAELIARTSRQWLNSIWVAVALVFLNYPSGLWDALQKKIARASYDQRLTRLLVANGMQSSGEVFSNVWDTYNLADPQFITYYNYGGWIELDSLYAKERPHPTATTVADWQQFFAAHGIHFAILQRRSQTKAIFRSPPADWKQLFSDERLTVWALPSAPDARQEAAQQEAAQQEAAQ